MLRSRLLLASCVVALAACGDDDSTGTVDDAGTGLDAGPDVDAGGPIDAGTLPEVDAGPPPACTVATTSVTFAPGFGGARDATLEAFAALGEDGPWAFGWRSEGDVMGVQSMAVEVAIVDATGTVVGQATLGEVTGAGLRIGQITLAPAGTGLLVAWEQAMTDMDGRVISSEVRFASLAADASVTVAEEKLYSDAAVPVFAADPPDAVWALRSDVTVMGTTTLVVPRFARLGADGTALSDDVNAQSFIQIEATDLALETRATAGPLLAYRVPPSTGIVVPLERTLVPMRPQRMVFDVPHLDDVAVTDDAFALAWSETAGGTARIGVVVTDAEGRERGRADLDEFDASYEAHVAVVRAWPAFVAVWRSGSGAEARLRAAGLDPYGRLELGPVDLATVPDLDGDLFAASDGSELTVGYRVTPPDAMPSLGITRACGPR